MNYLSLRQQLMHQLGMGRPKRFGSGATEPAYTPETPAMAIPLADPPSPAPEIYEQGIPALDYPSMGASYAPYESPAAIATPMPALDDFPAGFEEPTPGPMPLAAIDDGLEIVAAIEAAQLGVDPMWQPGSLEPGLPAPALAPDDVTAVSQPMDAPQQPDEQEQMSLEEAVAVLFDPFAIPTP